MRNLYISISKTGIHLRTALIAIILFMFMTEVSAQTPTVIPAGSFIVNLGVTPQTINNGLKPYGLLYALLDIKCPVHWIINTSKAKDGTDFNYNGVNYKGSAFIIEAQYRTPAVNALITTWTNPTGLYKVVGVTTTSEVTVPLYLTFWNIPRWTLDKQNGGIAVTFFANASIPPVAHGGTSSNGWTLPSELDCCDDLFVMPHADPIWATHGRLYDWMQGTGVTGGCKGSLWLGCHSGSASEDMFDNTTLDGDPIDYNQQTNSLANKTGPATGSGPWSENALILWGNHDDGTIPYSYDHDGDPVMQFLGTIDAATQNGSEQIYIPLEPGWRPTTKIGVYDPDHPERYNLSNLYKHRASILGYGPVFGVESNGKEMFIASHRITSLGNHPASVAAQRAFFNFSFLIMSEKAVLPELTGLPDTLYAGIPEDLSYTLFFNTPGTPYELESIAWSASCGGTFNTSSSNPTTYTPPDLGSPTLCAITVTITDECGRKTFDTHSAIIMPCALNITRTITPPSCYGYTNGSIAMNITGGTPAYNWTWNRTNPAGGPISGTGTTISSLSAGTYSVTVTDALGCSANFTSLVTDPAQIIPGYSVTNVSCFGGSTGSINMTVTGGTPPYTYDWADIAGPSNPEDRPNVPAATYNVTVTDSKGCTASASPVVGQPGGGMNLTGSITNVSCFGGSNGAINITVTGGTTPYNYDWADIAGTNNNEDRTGLIAGSYQVTVTDANGCTTGQTFTVTQPANLVLTTQNTQPTCPPNAQQNSSDGSINLTVTGGTPGFTYSWVASNGGTIPTGQADNEDLTGLVAGTYTVTVTDSKGCVKVLSVTLTYLNPNPVPPGSINN